MNDTCKMCGCEIPEGQRGLCSMCYGDPYYGRDGRYMQALEYEYERQVEKARWEALQEAFEEAHEADIWEEDW